MSIEISKSSIPQISTAINNMKELLNEVITINAELTKNIDTIPNFEALCERKIAIYEQMLNEYIHPHIAKRNEWIQEHPGVRVANDNSQLLVGISKEEIFNTKEAIKNPNFAPEPMLTAVVVPGKTNEERKLEAIAAHDKEVDAANKMLGGKVFMTYDDYRNRVSINKIKPVKLIDRANRDVSTSEKTR